MELTWSEFAKSQELGDDYWLYVVLDCATPSPRLYPGAQPSPDPGHLLAALPRRPLPRGPRTRHRRLPRIPRMSGRRLIEEKLPLREVNAESAREKSLRHGHISTMHLWWARRPLAMSRAVVFGTLLPDPGDKAKRKEILDLIARAAPFEAKHSASAIERSASFSPTHLRGCPPKVLDCFAGGGAIPLEALRLGCDVTAVDLTR